MTQHLNKAFILAGLTNIGGILSMSVFFTNSSISTPDPAVMSTFGLYMIILWGAAYIAVANHWQQLGWLCAVFCVEKIFYSVNWLVWLSDNSGSLAGLYDQHPMTGLFYSIYGIPDIIFTFVFGYAFIKAAGRA